MYYWKTKLLAEKIKNGSMNARERKNYYLATLVLSIILLYMYVGSGTNNGIATLAECISLVVITAIGINITFKSNGGDEGLDYIQRMVILSLPIQIKLFFLFLFVGVVIAVAVSCATGCDSNPPQSQWLVMLSSVVAQILYFWRLNIHISYINS